MEGGKITHTESRSESHSSSTDARARDGVKLAPARARRSARPTGVGERSGPAGSSPSSSLPCSPRRPRFRAGGHTGSATRSTGASRRGRCSGSSTDSSSRFVPIIAHRADPALASDLEDDRCRSLDRDRPRAPEPHDAQHRASAAGTRRTPETASSTSRRRPSAVARSSARSSPSSLVRVHRATSSSSRRRAHDAGTLAHEASCDGPDAERRAVS